MEISFLGAAQEVGRSCMHLSGSDQIMLDCGLKIHASENFPMDPPRRPDFVVVSHAHLDHTGFLPALYRHDRPELICTPPTLAMGELIIADSMKIMAHRGEFPYRAQHVKRMLSAATKLSYRKWYELGDSTLSFYQAGHIPGAAMAEINTGGKRILYSGDFKLEGTHTTFPSEFAPKNPDVLIMESTYSDRDHPPRKELEREFKERLDKILGEGGTVLLPAFAIGRTQELVRIVRTANRDVDIWIDGMGWKVSEMVSHFSSYMNEFKKLRADLDSCKPVLHKKDRDKVLKKPCVIIATAGMLQGGPALSYLLRLGPESHAIFTGYCVPETNGYNLINKGFVEYDGVQIKPKASHSYLDFSAHAGRSELFELAKEMSPQKIFCVHGDRCVDFAEELKVEGYDAHAPALGETVKI
ncbi:TPA: MBL fold metallo-hydrolase [Candidatus Micrarchaeota archaeon]|nr:MBL fold metallo-hydrolase [Candidatus Micrarchaeota archaeon]